MAPGQHRLATSGAALLAFAGPLGFGALLHAAGLQLGPALHALELGNLRAQLGDRLLQRRVLRQQAFHQSLKVAARQR